MRFKLIIALIEDTRTNMIIEAARNAGATGTTIIKSASGEGIQESKTFFGLTLESQRDVLLLLVEEHLSRHILEAIQIAGEFETENGAGIAFQIDVEDVVGITHQIEKLSETVEENI